MTADITAAPATAPTTNLNRPLTLVDRFRYSEEYAFHAFIGGVLLMASAVITAGWVTPPVADTATYAVVLAAFGVFAIGSYLFELFGQPTMLRLCRELAEAEQRLVVAEQEADWLRDQFDLLLTADPADARHDLERLFGSLGAADPVKSADLVITGLRERGHEILPTIDALNPPAALTV